MTGEPAVIDDRLVLAKDTDVTPPSTTVRFADWTPHGMYAVLTDAVEWELEAQDRSLEDDEFRDGDVIGRAVLDVDHDELLELEVDP